MRTTIHSKNFNRFIVTCRYFIAWQISFLMLFITSLTAELAVAGEITDLRLSNGLRVILIPNQKSQKISIRLRVYAGRKNQSQDQPQAAHVLEHTLFRHPDLSQNETFNNIIDARGGYSNAYTSDYETEYVVLTQNSELQFTLNVLAKMFIDREISDAQIYKSMDEVRVELGDRDPFVSVFGFEWTDLLNPPIKSNDLLDRALNHFPKAEEYSKPVERVSMENLIPSNVRRFYEDYYDPRNSHLVVTGNFEPNFTKKIIKQTIGKWKSTKQYTQGEMVYSKKTWSEPLIVSAVGDRPFISVHLFAHNLSFKEYVSLEIFFKQLEDRARKEIRNEHGLAYSASTSVSQSYLGSIFELSTDSGRQGFDHALKIIKTYFEPDNLEKLLSEESFNQAKTLYSGNKRLNYDDPEFLSSLALLYIKIEDYYDHKLSLFSDIEALTFEEYYTAIKKFSRPENLVFDVVSPTPVFPGFFMFSLAIIGFLTFATYIFLGRGDFEHKAVRLVRNFKKLPLIPEILCIYISFISGWTVDNIIRNVRGSYSNLDVQYYLTILTEYFFIPVLLMITFIFMINRIPKKLYVVGDSIVIKFLSVRSVRIPLSDITDVQVKSIWNILNPSEWFGLGKVFVAWSIPSKYYLKLETKGRSIAIFGIKRPSEVMDDLGQMIQEKHQKQKIAA
jgi:predicted Zn-dependent peptidase